MSTRLVVLLTFCTLAGCRTSPAGPPPPQDAPTVRVQGDLLVDSAGRAVRLRGVNRSGTEYACAQGWGIFDGPSDSASVQAIASWKATVVRVPLNETCWLGINGVAPAYSGANYRGAIAQYVALLNRAGLVIILDLHWSAADTGKVTSLMDWMDARQGSYLAWVWDVWGAWSDLIASYDGTPTPYGQTFRTRFGP